jgi:hypothetical protein
VTKFGRAVAAAEAERLDALLHHARLNGLVPRKGDRCAAGALFRLVLRLYPEEFRDRFGSDMARPTARRGRTRRCAAGAVPSISGSA